MVSPQVHATPRSKWTRRRRFIRGAVVLVILAAVGTTSLFLAQGKAFAAGARLTLSEIRDINYMPSDAAWAEMWVDWKPGQIASDYAHIAALGDNTVRVIVPVTVFHFPQPTKTMTARLAKVVAMATAAGLHVQLTLFDAFGLYGQIAKSRTFLNLLVRPYRSDHEIAFIELQNEVNPSKPIAMKWARGVIPTLRADAGDIPITASTTGTAGLAGMSRLKKALRTTPLNFYDYHFYGSPGQAYAQLAAAKAIAAPAGLIIGETGVSTGGGNVGILESQQAAFYEQVDLATSALHLPPAVPWMMYDLRAAGAPAGLSASTLSYGLYTSAGIAKPAAGIERGFLATGKISGGVLNPGFETVFAGLPSGWTASHAGVARLALSSTVAHSGAHAVSISGARGRVGAQARWETTANLGAVQSGEHVQASAWVEGRLATGHTAVSVSWFAANDAYLTTSTSASLPTGTTAWTRLAVGSAAPAGAAYAVINLESYANTGTVYFDDVGFVVTSR